MVRSNDGIDEQINRALHEEVKKKCVCDVGPETHPDEFSCTNVGIPMGELLWKAATGQSGGSNYKIILTHDKCGKEWVSDIPNYLKDKAYIWGLIKKYKIHLQYLSYDEKWEAYIFGGEQFYSATDESLERAVALAAIKKESE